MCESSIELQWSQYRKNRLHVLKRYEYLWDSGKKYPKWILQELHSEDLKKIYYCILKMWKETL